MSKINLPRVIQLEDIPEFQRFQASDPQGVQRDASQAAKRYLQAIHWIAFFEILWPPFEKIDYFEQDISYFAVNDPDWESLPSAFFQQIALMLKTFWTIQLADLYPYGDWTVEIDNSYGWDGELYVTANTKRRDAADYKKEEVIDLDKDPWRGLGNERTKEVFEDFGHSLIKYARDWSIRDLDADIIGKGRTPESKYFSKLPHETKEALRKLVPVAVDTTVAYFIFLFEENPDLDLVAVLPEGLISLTEVSDGLNGELYGDDGWIARFSEQRKIDYSWITLDPQWLRQLKQWLAKSKSEKTANLPMTKPQLEEIKNRCDWATLHPWVSSSEGDGGKDSKEVAEALNATEADLAFITHAKEDVSMLLSEIDRLNKLLDER
jgi:hypothetical protein